MARTFGLVVAAMYMALKKRLQLAKGICHLVLKHGTCFIPNTLPFGPQLPEPRLSL